MDLICSLFPGLPSIREDERNPRYPTRGTSALKRNFPSYHHCTARITHTSAHCTFSNPGPWHRYMTGKPVFSLSTHNQAFLTAPLATQ